MERETEWVFAIMERWLFLCVYVSLETGCEEGETGYGSVYVETGVCVKGEMGLCLLMY